MNKRNLYSRARSLWNQCVRHNEQKQAPENWNAFMVAFDARGYRTPTAYHCNKSLNDIVIIIPGTSARTIYSNLRIYI